jgi:hypothetical protein
VKHKPFSFTDNPEEGTEWERREAHNCRSPKREINNTLGKCVDTITCSSTY